MKINKNLLVSISSILILVIFTNFGMYLKAVAIGTCSTFNAANSCTPPGTNNCTCTCAGFPNQTGSCLGVAPNYNCVKTCPTCPTTSCAAGYQCCTSTNTCIPISGCCTNANCTTSTAPICNTTTHTCVGCNPLLNQCGASKVCCGTSCYSGTCCDNPGCTATPTTPICSSHNCVACAVGGTECGTGKVCCGPPTPGCKNGNCCTNANCPIPSPVCDLTDNTCKICSTANPCPAANPVCCGGSCYPTGSCCNNPDPACTGTTPVCNTTTHACVGCSTTNPCPAANPVCCSGSCYPTGSCCTDANCSNPTPICNTTTHNCVACTSHFQCGIGNKCCPTGSCNTGTPCTPGDTQCNGINLQTCSADGCNWVTTICPTSPPEPCGVVAASSSGSTHACHTTTTTCDCNFGCSAPCSGLCVTGTCNFISGLLNDTCKCCGNNVIEGNETCDSTVGCTAPATCNSTCTGCVGGSPPPPTGCSSPTANNGVVICDGGNVKTCTAGAWITTNCGTNGCALLPAPPHCNTGGGGGCTSQTPGSCSVATGSCNTAAMEVCKINPSDTTMCYCAIGLARIDFPKTTTDTELLDESDQTDSSDVDLKCGEADPPACGGTCKDPDKVCVSKFSQKKNKEICKCKKSDGTDEDDDEEDSDE